MTRWIIAVAVVAAAPAETFHYTAEWRLMEAGNARISYDAGSARLQLQTTGFPGKLYRVNDNYSVTFNEGYCASASLMKAEEGQKRLETSVTYHAKPGKAEYLERDLVANRVVRTQEIDVPACVHDVVTGLAKLRKTELAPGNSAGIPVSDGRKSALVRVVAQAKENVRTPAGSFACVKLEAFLFNSVIYRRKARLLIWLSDDARRVPVQIRLQMPFYLGTVTLQLAKEEQG